MNRLNFCAQAIPDLEKFTESCRRRGWPSTARMTAFIVELLKESVKFVMPDGGFLFEAKTPTESDMKLFRLPYPVIASEFLTGMPNDNKRLDRIVIPRNQDGKVWKPLTLTPKRIVLSVDIMEFTERYKQAFGPSQSIPKSYLDIMGTCAVIPITFLQDAMVWYPHWRIYYVNNSNSIQYAHSVMGEWGSTIHDDYMANGLDPSNLKDGDASVISMIQLCCALNCANVVVESIHAPAALNKKRAAKGKLPLFEYKTIKIEVPRETLKRSPQGGSHASPRLHIRRGHIRHLPDKAVWVNACMVGNKARGGVEKDYRIVSAGGRR